jgi:hypothetical protein
MEPSLFLNVLGELNWDYEINTGLPAGFIGPFRNTMGNGLPVVRLSMDYYSVGEKTVLFSSPWPTDIALGHDKA